MLIRAAFWIGLVTILTPHLATDADCVGRATCSAGANLAQRLSAISLHSLARVRVEIETDERDRQ